MTSLDINPKTATDRISDDNVVPTATDRSKLQPPALVAAMSPEQRISAENKLKRKIDTRLLPMIILMYIMNYLGEQYRAETYELILLTDSRS